MHASLTAARRYVQIAHPSFFVGLLLRGAVLPYSNYGHVVLAQPSPILFYPISSTEVREAAQGAGKPWYMNLSRVYFASSVQPCGRVLCMHQNYQAVLALHYAALLLCALRAPERYSLRWLMATQQRVSR